MHNMVANLCILDISHRVAAHCPQSANFFLEQTYPFLPAGTHGLVICDPGVGSMRRILMVRLQKRIWVGPDNGCMSFLIQQEKSELFVVDDQLPFCDAKRSTFEARDRMAPFMGHILQGSDPLNWVRAVDKHSAHTEAHNLVDRPVVDRMQVKVIHVDHFGNIVTSLKAACLPEAVTAWALQHRHMLYDHWVDCYQDIDRGVGLLIGSHGYVEIACRQASAAEFTGLKPGDTMFFVQNHAGAPI